MSTNTQKAAAVTVQLMPGTTALTMLFVVLKAFGKIDWSWWLVFAPMWGPWALMAAILTALFVLWAVASVLLAILEPVERRYRSWKWSNQKCKNCGQKRTAAIHQSSYPNSDRHYFLGGK